jgi:hypothetical protein
MVGLLVSANDVLSGKVSPDSLDAMYVAVYYSGFVLSVRATVERLLEAVNDMAKFGWRLRGCFEGYCVMERER